MNHELCGEFINHLDKNETLKCEHAPKNIQKWLHGLGLPNGLLNFMLWTWPQTEGQIGHISILPSVSLQADEATDHLLKHKFLNAGSAPNGDLFVIDFSTEACVPRFITHEEWSPSSDEPHDPRKFFQPIARTFESFLYRVVEGRYVPTDYYAAKEFNKFLADEQKASL